MGFHSGNLHTCLSKPSFTINKFSIRGPKNTFGSRAPVLFFFKKKPLFSVSKKYENKLGNSVYSGPQKMT
jgi:hypothetical protein